jgi:hypothetical protein
MPTFDARAYARQWRAVAALLVALSRASLPALLVLVVLATDPPIDPPLLLQLVVALALLPALVAGLIRRPCTARVELHAAVLVLRRRDLVVEIPCAALARVRPWTVPLPAPGLSVELRSGKRLSYAVEIDDPTPLLEALAARFGNAARAALQHPTVVYAHAAAAAPRWRWFHYLWKFVVFALLPTAVLFNAHQHIAYGGTLGEYYLLGAAAYARTFAVYWVTLAIYLILFASVWRGLAEAAAWLAAYAAPSQAAKVRRAAERCCRILYYAGVPALVAARFLT